MQGPVQPVTFQQLGVCAALDQPALVDDEDLVCSLHGRETVGDHHRGPPLHEVLERVLDERLRSGVEVRGRFVEHQDRRILENHPGDGDSLLLAAGQSVSTFADHGVVAVAE